MSNYRWKVSFIFIALYVALDLDYDALCTIYKCIFAYFFALVASVKKWAKLQLTNLIKICCTCFWLVFVRKTTNICLEVVIFIFFWTRKAWFKYQIPSHWEKKMSNLFKTHICLVYTFFSSCISEEMSQITNKSLIKIGCTWFWLSFVRKTTNA
jgi:hypothetical protein